MKDGLEGELGGWGVAENAVSWREDAGRRGV